MHLATFLHWWATQLEIWWKQGRKVYQAIESPCCQRFRLAVTLLREKQMKIGEGDFIWIISCFDWQSSILTVPRLLTSEEDRLGKIKTQVQSNTWIQLSDLWWKKKQHHMKIHSHFHWRNSTHLAYFLSRQKDNLYLCVSLLALTSMFTFDWLT